MKDKTEARSFNEEARQRSRYRDILNKNLWFIVTCETMMETDRTVSFPLTKRLRGWEGEWTPIRLQRSLPSRLKVELRSYDGVSMSRWCERQHFNSRPYHNLYVEDIT